LDARNEGLEVVLIKDAHSTFYKHAKKVIIQINNEMANAGVVLYTTEELIKQNDK